MATLYWTFIVTLWAVGIIGGALIGMYGCGNMNGLPPQYRGRGRSADLTKEDMDKHFRNMVCAGIGGWLLCIVTSAWLLVTVSRAIYFAINS